MDFAAGMTTLAMHGGSHVPEMLGSFHLDDHNVEEWSDATKPGTQHRARKEVGKWTNTDRNADIKYQKQEDNTKFDGGQEKQKREMIEGKAPDSAFQIIRTQRQVQDTNENNGSRVSTTSTSYQMSSSSGIRSTTKTTSNKTTSKTVTVSGGVGRSDDFENLKLSYQPLDTSTQRERINMSRSGTMGVRRPPTRRHNQAAILPEDDNGIMNSVNPTSSILNSDIINKESQANVNESSEPQPIIQGIKKMSPKICVGFPVEIQLELQTKLRGPGSMLHTNGNLSSIDHTKTFRQDTNNSHNTMSFEVKKSNLMETTDRHEKRLNNSTEFPIPILNNFMNSKDRGSSFDFSQRRKSYGFESFENPSPSSTSDKQDTTFESSITKSNNYINNHHSNSSGEVSSNFKSLSQQLKPLPSLSSSWDLIQSPNIQKHHEKQQQRTNRPGLGHSPANSQQIYSYSSYLNGNNNENSSTEEFSVPTKLNPFIEQDDDDDQMSDEYGIQNNLNVSKNGVNEYTLDSLEFNSFSEDAQEREGQEEEFTHHKELGGPDLVSNNYSSTSTERSRQLLKMVDETTPDLLNQMSFKNYMSSTPPQRSSFNALSASFNVDPKLDQETMWDDGKDSSRRRSHLTSTTSNESSRMNSQYMNNKHTSKIANYQSDNQNLNYNAGALDVKNDDVDDDDDDEFFLNDKKEFLLSRNSFHHDLANNKMYQLRQQKEENEDEERYLGEDFEEDDEFDLNLHNLNKSLKQTQVSQTWISSNDIKENDAQQYARDHDVTTSIYAINDPYRKPLKKVEFCKTEVHFTPEAGKFHIVESDENKPSTIHLYRRRKRGERKSSELYKTSLLRTNQLDQIDHDGKADNLMALQIDETYATGKNNLFSKRWALNNEGEKGEVMTSRSVSTPTNSSPANNKLTDYNSNERLINVKDNVNMEDDADEEDILIVSSAHSARSSSSPQFTHRKYEQPIRHKTHRNSSNVNANLDEEDKKMYVSLNLNLDMNENVYYEDEDSAEPPTHTIITNYGDLKIQRYLKQLKSPSLQTDSESIESIDDELNNHEREEQDLVRRSQNVETKRQNVGVGALIDDDRLFRYDNVLYEHGSFVPLATRKSLIEMNNRNRKHRHQQSTANVKSLVGTISDHSSTTSNYSLPCSDNSNKTEYQPLKLTAMEATVATTGPTPQITSVELRYSIDHNNSEYSNNSGIKKSRSFVPETTSSFAKNKSSHNNHRQIQNNIIGRDVQKSLEQIPSPVMPTADFYSIQPQMQRESRLSYSLSPSNNSPSQSPTHLNPKPPTPVPPIQYSSSAGKSGAEMRERFYSKNASCLCSNSRANVETKKLVDDDLGDVKNNSTDLLSNRKRIGTSPSKSVVTIGDGSDAVNFMKAAAAIKTESHQEPKVDKGTGEPILSLDHTWKGLAATSEFENEQKPGTSILRSLTFPKTSRPEPEWVSKARSREARVTDWNLVEKQYGSTNKVDFQGPPWISELRVKSKPSRVPEDAKSVPKVSVVYPWQRASSHSAINKNQENKSQSSSTRITKLNTKFSNIDVENTDSMAVRPPQDGKPSPAKSASDLISSTRLSNKRLIDVNMDSGSLVKDPSQTEVKPVDRQIKTPTPPKRASKEASSPNRSSKTLITDKTIVQSESPVNRASLAESEQSGTKSRTEALKSRKPLQTSTSLNKSNNASGRKEEVQLKPKTPPKPPKPPQRISSLTNTQMAGDNTDAKINPRLKKRSSGRTPDLEDSPGSTRSSTPIYLHPTVKVSKLPIKTQSKNCHSPDGKSSTTSTTNKTKSHGSLISETKRVCKAKLDEAPLIINNKSNSQASTKNSSSGAGAKTSPSPKTARRETESFSAKKKR